LASTVEEAVFKLTEVGEREPARSEAWTEPVPLVTTPHLIEADQDLEDEPPLPEVPIVDLVPPSV
jgi:hypothetical protein